MTDDNNEKWVILKTIPTNGNRYFWSRSQSSGKDENFWAFAHFTHTVPIIFTSKDAEKSVDLAFLETGGSIREAYENDLRWHRLRDDLEEMVEDVTDVMEEITKRLVEAVPKRKRDFAVLESYPETGVITFYCIEQLSRILKVFGQVDQLREEGESWRIVVDPRFDFHDVLDYLLEMEVLSSVGL